MANPNDYNNLFAPNVANGDEGLFEYLAAADKAKVSPKDAGQLGLASAIVLNEDLNDNTLITSEQIAYNLATTGEDIGYGAAKAKLEQEKQQDVAQAVIDAGSDPASQISLTASVNAGREIIAEPVGDRELVTASAQLLEDGTPQSARRSDGLVGFGQINAEAERLLRQAEYDIGDERTYGQFWGDFATFLIPFVNEADQSVLRATVSDVENDNFSLSQFAYDTGFVNRVANTYVTLPNDQKLQYLSHVVDNIKEGKNLWGGTNTIVQQDIIDQLSDKIKEGAATADEFTANNLVDEIERGIDRFGPFSIPSLIRRTLGAGLRKLGHTSVRSGSDVAENAARATVDMEQTGPTRIRMTWDADGNIIQTKEKVISPTRKNAGTVIDNINETNPDLVQTVLGRADDKTAAAQKGGLTVDELADRVIPQPEQALSPGGINSKFLDTESEAIERGIRNSSPTQLLTPAERDAVFDRIQQRAEALSGNQLGDTAHMSRVVENDNPQSLGTLRATYGNAENKPFDSLEDAETVAANLPGVETSVVYRDPATGDLLPAEQFRGRDGDFLVQVESTHTFSPTDATTFSVDGSRPLTFGDSTYTPFLLPPTRRINESILNPVSSLVDRNVNLVAQYEDLVRPAFGLGGDNFDALNFLLNKGDEGQIVYTRAEAQQVADAAGVKFSDRIWEGYQAVRQFYDTVYEARNARHYSRLNNDGFRNFTGENFQGFAKPSPAVPDFANVREVIDLDTGLPRPITQAELNDLYNAGGIAAQFDSAKTVAGRKFQWGVTTRNKGRFEALPSHTLSRRTGHIDRFYTETGFIIRRQADEVINGITVNAQDAPPGIVGIYPTRADAERTLTRLQAENEDVNFSIALSRENQELLDFYNGGVGHGYVPTHQRGRGEVLLGPNGNPAQTLDPTTAALKTLNQLRRELNTDLVDTLKQRFVNHYRAILGDNVREFPANLDAAIDARKLADEVGRGNVNSNVAQEAEILHDYINLIDQTETGQLSRNFNRVMSRWEESLLSSDSNVRNFLGRQVGSIIDTDIVGSMRYLATMFNIIGRPLYQISGNVLQNLNIVASSPIRGTMSVAQSIPLLIGFAARNRPGSDGLFKGLGRAFGMNGADFRKLINAAEDSGLITGAGLADDFLGQTARLYKNLARDSAKASALSRTMRHINPVSLSSKAQEATIRYGNVVAYIHAFKDYRRANRAIDPFSRGAQDAIINRARRLTHTQNSIDTLAYQNKTNPLAFMMQFMQFTHKMFIDIVADPVAKAAFNKQIGINAGPFTRSRAEAAVLLAGVGGVYGLQGFLGEGPGIQATDSLRLQAERAGIQVSDEAWDAFKGGMVNSLIRQGLDANTNAVGRISPAGYIDGVINFFDHNQDGIQMLGAFGSVWDELWMAGKAIGTFYENPEVSKAETVTRVMQETGRLFAGFRDAERAYVALNYGLAVSNSDLSATEKLNANEAILAAFSFRSFGEIYQATARNEAFKRKDSVRRIAQVYAREMNRNIAALGPDAGFNELTDVMTRYMLQARASVPDGMRQLMEDEIKRMVLREEDFLLAKLRNLTAASTYEASIDRLEKLKFQIQDDNELRSIDELINILKTNAEINAAEGIE